MNFDLQKDFSIRKTSNRSSCFSKQLQIFSFHSAKTVIKNLNTIFSIQKLSCLLFFHSQLSRAVHPFWISFSCFYSHSRPSCLPLKNREKFVYIFNLLIQHTTECKMINIASKAGNYLRATNQVVASGLRPLAGAALPEKKKVTTDNVEKTTLWSLSKTLPAHNLSVKSGLTSEY